jgi:hypothetical protein
MSGQGDCLKVKKPVKDIERLLKNRRRRNASAKERSNMMQIMQSPHNNCELTNGAVLLCNGKPHCVGR